MVDRSRLPSLEAVCLIFSWGRPWIAMCGPHNPPTYIVYGVGCRVFWVSLLATPGQNSQTKEWPVTPICSVTKCFSTWTSICSRFLSPFYYAILWTQNRRLPEEIDFSDGMEFACYPFRERFDFSDMYRFPGFWPGELLACPYISVEERYRDIQRTTKGQNSKRDQDLLWNFSLVLMVFVLNLTFSWQLLCQTRISDDIYCGQPNVLVCTENVPLIRT